MSLDLHHPLRGHHFGLAAQVPVIDDVVYGPSLLGQDAVMHGAPGIHGGGLHEEDTLLALARCVSWCERCWPGGRCGCGLPSGPSDTCRRCASRQDNLERRLGDAA